MREFAQTLVITVAAIVASVLLFSAFMFCYAKVSPVELYHLMYVGSFGNVFSIANTLEKAAPLILTALCTALPARVGLINIGAEGALVLGGYFGNQLLRSLAASHPAWRPWIGPVLGAYTVFALLTWLAQPFFNLLLWLHPVGRHALDDRQREQAEWVGCCLGMALLSGIGWFWLRPDELRGYGAILWVGLAIPVAAIWNCADGWPRTTMRIYAIGVAFFVVSATALIWWPSSIMETQRAMKDLAQLAVIGGGAGCFIGQWVAMGLSHMRPKL